VEEIQSAEKIFFEDNFSSKFQIKIVKKAVKNLEFSLQNRLIAKKNPHIG